MKHQVAPLGTGQGIADAPPRVRVLFADQLNLARGKYIPKSFAQKGAARFCTGTYAVTYARQLVAAPGAGVEEGLPDMEALFDPNDLRPGWEPNTEIALADLALHGKPAPLCGRLALKRAIADWRALGFDPMIGLEGEAYIFQRGDGGKWVPYDTPGAFVYGTGPFTDPAGLIDMLWAMSEACALPVESINAEYDSPQFELTLQYADALKACDDFFLFRTMARELLLQRGYLLSFMPKPIANRSGTGLHINISFNDEGGTNALAGGTERDKLSKLARGCIAGMIRHHEALGGIVAPTVNSYQRLKPASLCGYWANWGYDHRGVGVRVSAEAGAGARLEHRVGDCAASPYFAVAAVLQAARLGYVNGYDLPPAETGDGLVTVNTDRHVAESLGASLDCLAADTALCDAVGTLMIANFIAIKRAEIEEVAGKSPEGMFDYYAPFI
ncbi:MAG: glutamine synthetase [Alphaproteobacteria bacterium]|nr:MAG: glutamine synthetase [Alphaproteobacteria bacterium]